VVREGSADDRPVLERVRAAEAERLNADACLVPVKRAVAQTSLIASATTATAPTAVVV
jgi:hypothetical protein